MNQKKRLNQEINYENNQHRSVIMSNDLVEIEDLIQNGSDEEEYTTLSEINPEQIQEEDTFELSKEDVKKLQESFNNDLISNMYDLILNNVNLLIKRFNLTLDVEKTKSDLTSSKLISQYVSIVIQRLGVILPPEAMVAIITGIISANNISKIQEEEDESDKHNEITEINNDEIKII